MFAHLREEIAVVFERDPAARTTWEVITCYPGFHALLLHRAAHRLWGLGAQMACAFPLPSVALADRHRDPSRRADRPPLLHRSRHGRGDRRDRRDRRRLHALPRRHARRHVLEQGQAPSRRSATASSSAPAPRSSGPIIDRRRREDRLQRRRGEGSAGGRDRDRHSRAHRRSAGHAQAGRFAAYAVVRDLNDPLGKAIHELIGPQRRQRPAHRADPRGAAGGSAGKSSGRRAQARTRTI